MENITLHCKLVAQEHSELGYITYVFKSLDENQKSILKSTGYLMCVRFPNWNHKELNINDEGFVNIKIIQEGVDTWYDGNKFVPYIYTNIQFIKFIDIPKTNNLSLTID